VFAINTWFNVLQNRFPLKRKHLGKTPQDEPQPNGCVHKGATRAVPIILSIPPNFPPRPYPLFICVNLRSSVDNCISAFLPSIQSNALMPRRTLAGPPPPVRIILFILFILSNSPPAFLPSPPASIGEICG
jgi:hypothetical protein